MNITKKLCLISTYILLSLSTMKNANCQQQLSAFKNVERETIMSTRTSPPASSTSSQQSQQQQQVILINSSNNNIKENFAKIISTSQNSNNNNNSPQSSNQSQKQNLNNITFNLIYMQTLSDSYKNYANVSSTLIKKLQIIQNKALIISDVTEFEIASDHNQFNICNDDESIIDHDVHDDDIQPNRFTQCEDSLKLMKLVMDGLGLKKIPDMTKVNISQQEYSTKYREYLRRVYVQKRDELDEIEMLNAPLQMYSIVPNNTQHGERQKRDKPQNQKASNFRSEENGKTNIFLHFALNFDLTKLQPDGIEEANIRLMLIHSPSLALKNKSNKNNDKSKRRPCGNEGGTGKIPKQHTDMPARQKQRHLLNLKVYQLLPHGKRVWLDGQKLEIEIDDSNRDRTHNQWLQFDVTKAVETWLRERQSNLGLEVHCNNCHRIGARILNDPSASPSPSVLSSDGDNDYDSHLMPVLNVIGRLGVTHQERLMRKHSTNTDDDDNNGSSSTHHHNNMSSKSGEHHKTKNHNDCYKANQRCCRHTMEVVFKEIKGFEFIIQPKVFDAGYCHGRCPPRYNPAHHHALLQSLIWKHSRTRAPRLCCAPSKLVELEVLHVDEKDSEKLKISTWTDMRVIECACT